MKITLYRRPRCSDQTSWGGAADTTHARRVAKTLHFTGIALLIAMLSVLLSPVQAEIFKWQDANGNWHFSDQAPDGRSAQRVGSSRPTTESAPAHSLEGSRDLAASLLKRFAPTSPIEQVTLAVVGIETPLGQGSGFFISESGLIVTNKHVIRPQDTEKHRERRQDFDERAQYLESVRQQIREEEERLNRYARDLESFREEIEKNDKYNAPTLLRRQEYAEYLRNYERRREQLNEARRQYQAQLKDFEKQRDEFSFNSSLAGAARHFTVFLKDNREMTAELVSISRNADLALLRIPDVISPALPLGDSRPVRQGHQVFAVGSPLGMRDSLTSGIIARVQSDYLVTDAQILPGNSGGPLLNDQAQVVGINTLKFAREATADGFGMAIRVETLREEFPDWVKP